jgi:hypothetical protein
VGHKIAKARCKAFLPDVIEMFLATEEDHSVPGERGLDRSHGRIGQIAREADILNLRANATCKWANLEVCGLGLGPLHC